MEITKKELISKEERKFPKEILFRPIGKVRSPFKSLKGIPIQSKMSKENGVLEIFPEYQGGIFELTGFSHLICLYYFDMVKLPVPIRSKPFLSNEKKGVFATRTPFRPNPIGLSILTIVRIEENMIYVSNLDVLDDTPIFDLKPYVPEFDSIQTKKIGWLKGKVKYKLS